MRATSTKSATAKSQPRRVCVLAYDGLCTFEFGVGVELFGLPRPEFSDWYDFRVVAAEPGPLRATGGITVDAPHGLDALVDADLLLVPGWRGVDVPVPADLVAVLRQAHANGARLASICSGVFVLAATGLLDGRSATTHWRYADALTAAYPKIRFEPDVLFVDSGDVLTSAGSAAGIDLCLHVIRKDFGAKVANSVARRLVLSSQREGGQRQFIEFPAPRQRSGQLAPLLEAIKARLDEDWPIARMTREAGLSRRTLARRFQDAFGQSALEWLSQQRAARACELLEDRDLPLTDVASACGFNSMETFRREFKRHRGIAPGQHRKSFGAAVA